MIKLIKNKNIWGLQVTVNKDEKFVRIGTAEYMASRTPEQIKLRVDKAKELERIFCCNSFRPPVLFSDMLRGGKLKFVQASSGKVKLSLPDAAPIGFAIDPLKLDADIQYLALRVFNHFGFPTNGASFHVAKSLLRMQLNSAR